MSCAGKSCVASGLLLSLFPFRTLAFDPGSAETTRPPEEVTRARLESTYGRLPVAFEANHGQTKPEARFLARYRGGAVFVTRTGAAFTLTDGAPRVLRTGRDGLEPSARSPAPTGATFRMRVVGAKASDPVGLQKLPGRVNHFTGNDPSRWRTDIPTYAKVKIPDVYSGIDLIFHGNQRQLEYDFVAKSGADYSSIRIAFEGVDQLKLNDDGDLVLSIAGREVVQRRPRVFERADGRQRELKAGYALLGGTEVSFRVAGHDSRHELVIDPVLAYSTFLGGSAADYGASIAVDPCGNAYVAGFTQSADFPTVNPVQMADGLPDVFVAKLNVAGTALLYSTYLGGAGADYGYGIAVDPMGNAYVTGETSSSDFPTVGPITTTPGGGADGFVVKLDARGRTLVYSAYLGGSGYDRCSDVAVDARGNAYVTGTTESTDFPATSRLGSSGASLGASDAFVAKLNAAGSALTYATLIGGSRAEEGKGIAVDLFGNAYVTGTTYSDDFPAGNGLQTASIGGPDAFVCKLNGAGNALVYSTYLGGSGADYGADIALDLQGNAYVTGTTRSADFPTAGPVQPAWGLNEDAFVAKLNTQGSHLVYSTYLGGAGFDWGEAIALDAQGNAYVTGYTFSRDFPLLHPIQWTLGGIEETQYWDAFVTRLNAAGTALDYSTYLGGGLWDSGSGIAVDLWGNAYVTGTTGSPDFPTAWPLQPTLRAYETGFVTKVAPSP